MARDPNYCDLCGEERDLERLGAFSIKLPEADLIHTAHQEEVEIEGEIQVDICYDCTPHLMDWLSSSCSLCGDRVDIVFRYKLVGRADFQFITGTCCSGWELKEE